MDAHVQEGELGDEREAERLKEWEEGGDEAIMMEKKMKRERE